MPELKSTFGADARIHIPTHWTYGALLDGSMPVGTTWPPTPTRSAPAISLALPFIVVETGEGAIVEISSRTTDNAYGVDRTGVCMPFGAKRRPPSATVERTNSGFAVTFRTHTEDEPRERTVSSVDEVIETHVSWINENYSAQTVEQRVASGELAPWVTEVPLTFTFDMWLPNGEVAHNYVHLRDFCRDMGDIGVPPGVVVYIPGWCGPYDAGYPYYKPVPELGGRTAFAEAMAAAHENGYRVMAHTLGWGTDPYVPDFEKHTRFVMRNYGNPSDPPPPIVHNGQMKPTPDGSPPAPAPENDPLHGPYGGWPGGGVYFLLKRAPLSTTVSRFQRSAGGWLFDSPEIPARCEAVVRIGGLEGVGAGVVKIAINGRSLTTPPDWFSDNEGYSFPFTFLLAPGINPVEITVYGAHENSGGVGEGSTEPGGTVTFTVEQMYGHDPTHNVWTQPAVGANLDDPRWHDAFCEHLVPTVAEFGIDLVHIDATSIWRLDDESLFAKLRRELPKGTCFGTEVASEAGMGFFLLKQARVPRASGGLYSNYGAEEKPESDRSGNGWAPARSDLPYRFSRQYGHFYAHLCSGHGLVPHHTSCSVNPMPGPLSEEESESVSEFMRCSAEAHIAPTLRLNYRELGIDNGTRRFLEGFIQS